MGYNHIRGDWFVNHDINEIEAVKFDGEKLILLDQRKIPRSEEYVECTTAQDVADAIKNMVVRGAPAIGVATAYALAMSNNIEQDSNILKNSRPTAVDLLNAINYMQKGIKEGKMNRIKLAEKWHDEIRRTTKKISEYGASLIKDNSKILLHCNAGPIATAGYGTSLGAVIKAHNQGKKLFVYVDETRPRFQGALTAWELEKTGIPHKVIVDSAAGYLIKTAKVDYILVGADRVVKNGDFANKIGTYPLAVLANENNVPFYVLFPTTTMDRKTKTGEDIVIEERNEREVLEVLGKRVYGKNTRALNLAFDITPSRYVSKYITENGIYNRADELWRNITE